MVRMLTWWEQLDLDWEVELLLLDVAAQCGNCTSTLYADGTCPNCDRASR